MQPEEKVIFKNHTYGGITLHLTNIALIKYIYITNILIDSQI